MIINFKYKKSPEDVSNRTVVVLDQPSNKYFGIDVSDLDEDEQEQINAEIQNAQDTFKTETIAAIIYKYELQNKFRNFLVEKMEDVQNF